MNTEEYEKLSAIETQHWFYVGKRDIVKHWLQRTGPLDSSHSLLDCGAGTGKFVEEMSHICHALALDDHEESLVIAREKLGFDRVVEGRCTALPFADNSIDAITALDVLEHIDNHELAVHEIFRVLKPGGKLVVTVPAIQSLWSDWDVALHHHRRYTKATLLSLLEKTPFKIIHWNYINVVAFPAVWTIRKIRAMTKSSRFDSLGRAEDSIPPEPINGLLRWIFVKLACQKLIRFPVGVGLLGVWQKPRSFQKDTPE